MCPYLVSGICTRTVSKMKVNTELPWWIFALFLGQLCQGYKISVNILTNGPIPVGSSVSLTCAAHPIPPGPLSYLWYSSLPNSYYYITSQGPNATVYIGTSHPKQGLYFCHVQSNGSEVAVGYAVIKPQGFLIPIGPTEITYRYGNTVVLGVNISSYYIAPYIQSLQWYRDGNPVLVNCSSDMRVYSNTLGTRLTIQRAGRSDEGEYMVKIQSILYVDNSTCSNSILSLLEGSFAVQSPVIFTVSSSSSQGGPGLASSEAIIYINTTKRIFVQTKVSNMAQFQFQSCPCLYCPILHETQLYFNGYPLSDSRVSYIIQSGTITLNISNATSNDFGVYEVLVTFCIGYPFCLPSYFINVFGFFGPLYEIETFTVNIYVPPQVSLQALSTHLDQHTTSIIAITCAALNGTPDAHNITMMKNGSVLETTVGGNSLTYSVTWSGLGQYVCEVDSLYSTQQESVVLRESAMTKLQVTSSDNLPQLCANEPMYVQKMTSQLRDLSETLCSCTLGNDTFVQTNVTCPSSNGPLIAEVTVWLQYASDDGLMTASDLVDMIQTWLLDSACGCIAVGGPTLQLTRGCCSTNGSEAKPVVSVDTLLSPDAQVIVGTFGGFVGGVLLTICIGACTIVSIAWRLGRSSGTDMRNPVDGASAESSARYEMKDISKLEMEENAAYHTVR